MQRRTHGHWPSTQDNAAVVEALSAFHTAYERVAPDLAVAVRVAGRTMIEAGFRERSTRAVQEAWPLERVVAAADTAASRDPRETVPIDLEARGAGRLYYSVLLESYAEGPQPARTRGLAVERLLEPIDRDGTPTAPPLAAGETVTLDGGDFVRVTLRLTSAVDRNYVVVDDALPAGLEALNPAIDRARGAMLSGSGRQHWWGSWNHTETHDDRVVLFADFLKRGEHTFTYVARATTPGTFVHPPVAGELMYEPEVNGRTASGTLIVRAPRADVAAP
jgi:hypothetical protein